MGPRPAVLGSSTLPPLQRLLGFRHFFRHAYGIELDWRELRLRIENVEEADPLLRTDLTRFVNRMREVRDGLEPRSQRDPAS